MRCGLNQIAGSYLGGNRIETSSSAGRDNSQIAAKGSSNLEKCIQLRNCLFVFQTGNDGLGELCIIGDLLLRFSLSVPFGDKLIDECGAVIRH